MFDAGLNAAKLDYYLRLRDAFPSQLAAVFVSHEHIDHLRGVGLLARRPAVFQPEFREDLHHWVENWVETDRRTALRVLSLVETVLRDPFGGIGKPEPLKYLGRNVWSRRITQEHRLVYLVRKDRIDFLQARFHY